MKTSRAFKTELDLNNKQKTACLRHAGAARFAYIWGLARKKAAFANGEKTPTAIDLHGELNALKKSELTWMYDVSKCAPQEALRDLDRAFAHFFRRLKEKRAGKKVKPGFPKFKTKKKGLGSFRLTGTVRVFERSIQLPPLGLLRLKENGYLPTTGVPFHAERESTSAAPERQSGFTPVTRRGAEVPPRRLPHRIEWNAVLFSPVHRPDRTVVLRACACREVCGRVCQERPICGVFQGRPERSAQSRDPGRRSVAARCPLVKPAGNSVCGRSGSGVSRVG